MPRKAREIVLKDPGDVVKSDNHTPIKAGTLKRMTFNNAPDFDKSLKNSGVKAGKQRKPVVGSSYRITDGRYAGEMCKVFKVVTETHLEVEFLDVWLKPTGKRDLVPASYLRVNNEQREA